MIQIIHNVSSIFGPAPLTCFVRRYHHTMKMLKYLPLVLCMTTGATAPAEDEVAGIGVELKVAGQSVANNPVTLKRNPSIAKKVISRSMPGAGGGWYIGACGTAK